MFTWNVGPCSRRTDHSESIEDPNLPEGDLSRLYDFTEFLNRRLGGTQIILGFLKDCSHQWENQQTISILDLFCGRGELSRQIVDWARAHKKEVRIFAVDPSARAIHAAQGRLGAYPEIVLECRAVSDPLFLQAQQFDYVVSTLSLHRQSWEEAVRLVRTMNLLARRGVIICDWLRDVRAWAWMALIGKLWGDDWVRNETQLAIQKGFTLREAGRLLNDAGTEYLMLRRHLGYRFSLSGERRLVVTPQLNPLSRLAGA